MTFTPKYLFNTISIFICYMASSLILNINLINISIFGLHPILSAAILALAIAFFISLIFNFKNTSKQVSKAFNLVLESVIIALLVSLIFDLLILHMAADLQNIIISISLSKLFLITFTICLIAFSSYSFINNIAKEPTKKNNNWNLPNLFYLPAFFSALFYTLSFFIDKQFPGLIGTIFNFTPFQPIINIVLIGVVVGLLLYLSIYRKREPALHLNHIKSICKMAIMIFIITLITTLISAQALGIIQTSGFLSLFTSSSAQILLEPLKLGVSSGTLISSLTLYADSDNEHEYTYISNTPKT
jgi:hypothetical protein